MGKTLRMPTISSILAGGSADPNVDIDEIDKHRRSKTEEILYAQMTQKLQF